MCILYMLYFYKVDWLFLVYLSPVCNNTDINQTECKATGCLNPAVESVCYRQSHLALLFAPQGEKIKFCKGLIEWNYFNAEIIKPFYGARLFAPCHAL